MPRGRLARTIPRMLLLALVGVYVGWCAILYLSQGAMLFPRGMIAPARQGPPPTGAAGRYLDAPGGVRVEHWLYPPTPDPAAPTLIFFHGNAELIDHAGDIADAYLARGFNVVLAEYRGYGRSTGTPSQAAITADMLALHDSLVREHGLDPSRFVYHGRSLGAAVAVQLAKDRPPAALILQSPFTSVASFAAGLGAPPMLVTNPYRTDRVLPTLTCPILILHGASDTIIPPSHGRRLAALRPGTVYAELPGGHNDFPLDPAAYWARIDEFLSPHRR